MLIHNHMKIMTSLLALLVLAAPSVLARPGDGKPLDKPHPGYTLEQARPDHFKPQVGALSAELIVI